MTVCITGLFRWNYGSGGNRDYGVAALTVSDRMITAGDVEYEPEQRKVAFMTANAALLVAGDYSVHSEAIVKTHKQVRGDKAITPHNLALIYGRQLQQIKMRQAEDRILAPLGLNAEAFLAQQREMNDAVAHTLTSQMQDHEGPDVTALVAGIDHESNGTARIYEVDTHGTARCFDDVGFAAIGIGGWHARSWLMQSGYVNWWTLAPALAAVFSAKKAAEVAPGVGRSTDIHIITKDGINPLWPNVAARLEELYSEYSQRSETLVRHTVLELQEYILDPKTYQAETTAKGTAQEGFTAPPGENRSGDSGDPGSGAEARTDNASEGSSQLQGEES